MIMNKILGSRAIRSPRRRLGFPFSTDLIRPDESVHGKPGRAITRIRLKVLDMMVKDVWPLSRIKND
jgi:hypothetical protein